MATYYIDCLQGCNALDGFSPETAKKSYKDLPLLNGDCVLFKRGSFYRDKLYAQKHITYGAYGEGERPTFCGSFDVSLPEDWVETPQKNVWKCIKPTVGDVGNFVFNQNECTATFRWNREELCQQGDFWDSRFGQGEQCNRHFTDQELLMYSAGNPATVYSHIEAAAYHTRHLVDLKEGMTLDGLRFINSGVHALAGGGDHITVRNCAIENIGGCAWNKDLQIRFGNGFEIWENGNEILVENCFFQNIYDSCVTHQGPGDKTHPAHRFICRSCVFDTYGMAAFEYRDKMPVDSSFTENICLNAGCGFAMLGETMPRRSEIWPRPMGHHIFMWRIDEKTEHGDLRIENNLFGGAPEGAAIYSIISPQAEAQVTLDGNRYTPNSTLLLRWGGTDYCDLDAFRQATKQEKHGSYARA